MPPIRYSANFISTVYLIDTEVDAFVNPTNTSGNALKNIKAKLKQASEAFNRKRYRLAIKHYKTARSLVYKLLNPQHKLSRFVGSDQLVLPASRQLEIKLAEAGVKLIESMQPDVIEPEQPIRVRGVEIPNAIRRYDELGYQRRGLVGIQLEERIQQGTELIAKGHVTEAVELLTEVVKNAATHAADDPNLRSAASLNLSTALLSTQRFEQATKVAQQAAKQFQEHQDLVGQAQALHNVGVALKSLGKTEQAQRFLKQSSSLYAKATAPQRLQTPDDGPDRRSDRSTDRPIDRRTPTRPNFPIARPITPRINGDQPVVAQAANFRVNKRATIPVRSVELADKVMLMPETSRLSGEILRTARPTTDLQRLSFIKSQDTSQVSLRWLGETEQWSRLSLEKIKTPVARQQEWELGISVGNDIAKLKWQRGQSPKAENLLQAVYQRRINAQSIDQLRWFLDSEAATAAYLSHVYAYVIPVGLGDCYHEQGNYQRAEQYYLQAARYSFISRRLEAPNLWVKLAQNVLEWGDRLYKEEKIEAATEIYSKLVTQEGTINDNSPLYQIEAFQATADQVGEVLANLSNLQSLEVNPAILMPILLVWARWQYLIAGLDFYGLTFTPVFTFEYLQQAARAFAQQSIQAEREYVNFTVQAEAEAATRRELENALTMAEAEVRIQQENARAAVDDARAADAAVDLAQLRAQNADEDRSRYASAGYWQYVTQSIATAHSAQEDWHGDEIRRLARDIENGSWEGDAGKLAAAATLLGGQKSYEYQLARMQDQIEEMNAMVPVAEAQARAAAHRERAAQLQYEAARARRNLLDDALNAFENETFTPELWNRMATVMRYISRSYQQWAIGIAKLMERAYNFETDSNLQVIKTEYPVPQTGDLLGSDFLLRDIDSFTYHYITNTQKKESQLKDVISLRNDYPFHFYEFLQSGRLTFETSLHDFDRAHPGFYGQRLQAIEVEVVGLLPPEGIQGTLRGGIVSRYRQANGTEKTRVHGVDTIALSNYTVRNDAFIFRSDIRKMGLFEGHGVATTWELDLPRRSNNLDYRLITDVRLVLYYNARYSHLLRDQVLSRPPLPGETIHVRDFAMRYDFPEVWYQFLRSQQMTFTLDPDYLPRNETAFTTDKVALRLIASEGTDVENVELVITLPGQAPITMTTNGAGEVATENGNALAQAMGGALLGDWTIVINPPDNSPLLNDDGSLNGSVLQNLALITQYNFEDA